MIQNIKKAHEEQNIKHIPGPEILQLAMGPELEAEEHILGEAAEATSPPLCCCSSKNRWLME